MTVEQAREIALAQPEAFESAHNGHPDFRIPQGIFASLWPDQDRSVLRLPPPLADGLAKQAPETFRIVSRYGGMGWVSVTLSKVDLDEFRSLMETAWQARTKK